MANTVNIRTSKKAGEVADEKLKVINKLRKKEKNLPISKSKLIEVAINNVTIEMGVKS